jgi:dienelactone hydrolase
VRTIIGLFILLTALACGNGVVRSSTPPVVQETGGAKQITFDAKDGQTVYGDLYKTSSSQAKAVILMFHQAGSNAGEYATIAPQIIKLGADCLAVDQRSGGNMFDRTNRTATTAKGPEEYMDAYNDLQGAVIWAKAQGYKTIIPWGSSYSAALTLQLLSQHPELPAGLVFSPGEYMDDKNVVSSWARSVKVPVFFACTPDELKDGRQQIFNALNGGNPKGTLQALPGSVHGSSMCIADKCTVAAQNVAAAEKFLKSFLH